MTELSPMNPCWRYHATQGAKLFVTAAELDAAEAAGWRDSPGAATALALAAVAEPVIDEKVEAVVSKKHKRKPR